MPTWPCLRFRFGACHFESEYSREGGACSAFLRCFESSPICMELLLDVALAPPPRLPPRYSLHGIANKKNKNPTTSGQANEELATANLASKSGELEAAKAELERAAERQAAASEALADRETAAAALREELHAAKAARDEARTGAEEAEGRSEELSAKISKVRQSCSMYQERAVTAEGSLKELAERLEEYRRAATAREEALIAAKEESLARDRLLRAKEAVLEAVQGELAAKGEELASLLNAKEKELETLQGKLAAKGEELASLSELLEKARLEGDAGRETLTLERAQKALEEEVAAGSGIEGLEERVEDAQRDLAAEKGGLWAQKDLGSAGGKLEAAEAAEASVGGVAEADEALKEVPKRSRCVPLE